MIFYPKAKSWAAATVADRLPSPVTRITSRGTKVPAQTMRKSGEEIMRFSVLAATTASLAAIALAVSLSPQAHAESPVERGSYLVVVAGCNDCHTPGFFLGKPDKDKFLGGSDVGFEIPGLGVFNGRNITPDKETGIGAWTDRQTPRWTAAGADHELCRLYASDQGGCGGRCRLSPQHTSSAQPGGRTVQAGRKSVDLHLQNRATGTDGGRRAEVINIDVPRRAIIGRRPALFGPASVVSCR